MKKLNTKGFGAVEAILILVIVGILGFVGWYVWRAGQSNKSTASTTASVPAAAAKKPSESIQTPQQTIYKLAAAMKSKNKASFDALISVEMKADAKANGVPSPYDSFAADKFSTALFTQVDYSKYKPTVIAYTSKAGVKGGKQLTYTMVTTTGGTKSTNVYKFDFVPKGNGWLLDDMSLDFNGSANISTP